MSRISAKHRAAAEEWLRQQAPGAVHTMEEAIEATRPAKKHRKSQQTQSAEASEDSAGQTATGPVPKVGEGSTGGSSDPTPSNPPEPRESSDVVPTIGNGGAPSLLVIDVPMVKDPVPSGEVEIIAASLTGVKLPELAFDGKVGVGPIRAWADTLRDAWIKKYGGFLSNRAIANIVRHRVPQLQGVVDQIEEILGGKDSPASEQEAWEIIRKGVHLSGGSSEVAVINEVGIKEVAATQGRKGGKRYELFGHNITSVIRWMGKEAWTFQDIRTALDKLGFADVAEATIRAQQLAGRKGLRGSPAELTADQQKQLDALVD